MTPDEFAQWLVAVKAAGLAKTDNDAANLLGYRDVFKQKRNGGDERLALACAAVLAGLPPFPQEPPKRRKRKPVA